MAAPTRTASIVSGPDSPMDRKKPRRNRSLKPSMVFASSSALPWPATRTPRTSAPQVALQADQLESLRSAEGEQQAIEDQELTVAGALENTGEQRAQRNDEQHQERPDARSLARRESRERRRRPDPA